MHRAKESDLRSKLEEERKKVIDEARWVIEPSHSQQQQQTALNSDTQDNTTRTLQVKYESSFGSLFDQQPAGAERAQIFGRRSFNQFNKEVERLHAQYTHTIDQPQQSPPTRDDQGAEIADDEMFRRHQRYVGIGKHEAQSIVNALADDDGDDNGKNAPEQSSLSHTPPTVVQSLREKKSVEKRKRQQRESPTDKKAKTATATNLPFRKPT
jgi:hypothetical protein